jgi:hypothetical protein
MCCTTTIGWPSDGSSFENTSRSAFGPPVDIPIAIISIGPGFLAGIGFMRAAGDAGDAEGCLEANAASVYGDMESV